MTASAIERMACLVVQPHLGERCRCNASAGARKTGSAPYSGPLERSFTGLWDLVWVRTYAFMGSHLEADLPAKWARLVAELGRKHPRDGASFCSAWRRAPQGGAT